MMRIKAGYKLRDIAGETIIVNQGTHGIDMTKVISLNSSARFLYEQLEGKEFSREDVKAVLMDRYEIDPATAEKGAEAWIGSMEKCGVIE